MNPTPRKNAPSIRDIIRQFPLNTYKEYDIREAVYEKLTSMLCQIEHEIATNTYEILEKVFTTHRENIYEALDILGIKENEKYKQEWPLIYDEMLEVEVINESHKYGLTVPKGSKLFVKYENQDFYSCLHTSSIGSYMVVVAKKDTKIVEKNNE